jgi:tRNA-Thr(GGU) m(6)t(6)A37 methyltransferase TsaA
MNIVLHPIGFLRTPAKAEEIPRHWSLSDLEGSLEIIEKYREGLRDIATGGRIVVLFHFHRSPEFTPELLTQTPPHRNRPMGVFSICSPRRPNPIGLSVLEVLEVRGNIIRVRGIDMFDGTPILDIKPFITGSGDCPSAHQNTAASE